METCIIIPISNQKPDERDTHKRGIICDRGIIRHLAQPIYMVHPTILSSDNPINKTLLYFGDIHSKSQKTIQLNSLSNRWNCNVISNTENENNQFLRRELPTLPIKRSKWELC